MRMEATRAHYETQARDALGRYTPSEIDRFAEINRWFADPVYRAEVEAERQTKTAERAAQIAAECDRVFAVRAPARREREIRRLMDTGAYDYWQALAVVDLDDPLPAHGVDGVLGDG